MKKVKKSEIKEATCLDSIINKFFNDKDTIVKVFLSKVKKDKFGNVTECFTKEGGKLYERMVDCIFSIGNNFHTLGDLKSFIKSLEIIGMSNSMSFSEIVDKCDEIADGTAPLCN